MTTNDNTIWVANEIKRLFTEHHTPCEVTVTHNVDISSHPDNPTEFVDAVTIQLPGDVTVHCDVYAPQNTLLARNEANDNDLND